MRSTHILLALAAAALPGVALAQPTPATTTTATTPSPEELSGVERDALSAAEQLAADAGLAMEQWVTSQSVTEPRLFARMYFPVAGSDPLKFTTSYDTFADRDLTPLEDKTLARSTAFQYAIVADVNGYVPAHNTRFAQPKTGNAAQDAAGNRTKRSFGDTASIQASRSEARFLVQRVKLETGDIIGEVSVPLTVRGKRWGSVRVGFRRG